MPMDFREYGYYMAYIFFAGLLFLLYKYFTSLHKNQDKLARLALFPEQNPNPVIEINFKGEATYMNPAALKRFPGMMEKGLDHPLFEKMRSSLDALKDNENFICEIELGSEIFEQKIYTIGESKLWRIYSSDITAQKQIEKKLANLALFPMQNPNPVIEVDLNGKITYMNPAALNRFPDMQEMALAHPLFNSIRGLIPVFRSHEMQTFKCEIVVGEETYEQKVYAIPHENILRIYSSDVSERKRNEELIQKKNKDITDSINYARRLQYAILPDDKTVSSSLPESFFLYKPKDIVSGDFYWFHKKANSNMSVLAAVDCTGHGVPGAFMSMIGNFHLSSTVIDQGIADPSEILSILDKKVCAALKQESEEAVTKDGMEVSLCVIDHDELKIHFVSAMRPLYILKKGELVELKGNKFSIGGFMPDKKFTTHSVQLDRGDTFYLTSDGYADQTGGDAGKKFMSRKLKELLASIQHHTMNEQKEILEDTFEKWKGEYDQVDDVMVIGVRMV
jgi:serine phosphatase RsbU (regulator of sigma subunit)